MLALIALVVTPRIGRTQVARMEVLPFEAITFSDDAFLAGRKDGKRATIAGELRLPKAGNDKLPPVILLHGSSGIGGYVLTGSVSFSRWASPPSSSSASRVAVCESREPRGGASIVRGSRQLLGLNRSRFCQGVTPS